MRTPGFTAEASLYRAGTNHLSSGSRGTSDFDGVIPMQFDLCNRCKHLSGCAQARCYCICNGGDWSPGHFGSHFPCGICF